MGEQVKAELTIHVAGTQTEREAIYRLRYQVYVTEMGKVNLADADHERQWISDALDPISRHSYVLCNDQVVGCLRMFMPACWEQIRELDRARYQLEAFREYEPTQLMLTSRLMIDPSLRGSSALYLLLNEAYEAALQDGRVFDFCSAAPALVDMYEHLGYRRFAENYVDPEVGYRVPLVLALRDGLHMKEVGSPFWRKLRSAPEIWESDTSGAFLRRRFPMAGEGDTQLRDDQAFWNLMMERVRPQVGRSNMLLDGLDEQQIRQVMKHGTVLRCRKGDTIIRTNEVGREMFVVLSGLVEVRHPENGRQLAVLDSGHVFGEVAFVAGMSRSADVVALLDSEVFVISRATLDRLMSRSSELAMQLLFNLAKILSERLVLSTRRISQS